MLPGYAAPRNLCTTRCVARVKRPPPRPPAPRSLVQTFPSSGTRGTRMLDARVTPLAQDDRSRRVTGRAVRPIVVAGKVVPATAPLADLPLHADPLVVISDVLFPALVWVWRGHRVAVTLAHGIVTDSSDGGFSARDTGLAGGQRGIADQPGSMLACRHRRLRGTSFIHLAFGSLRRLTLGRWRDWVTADPDSAPLLPMTKTSPGASTELRRRANHVARRRGVTSAPR